MGSPVIFNGARTKLLTSKGLLLQSGRTIDYDGQPNYMVKPNFPTTDQGGWGVYSLTTSTTNSITVPTGSPGTVQANNSSFAVGTTNSNPLGINPNSLAITASGGATILGNAAGSPVFTIPRESVAKVLTVKMAYEATLNPSNLNFSGGFTTQSLSVWIYNVNAGTWIQPQGCYGINQGVGPGQLTSVTFQSSGVLTETSYQLFVVLTGTVVSNTWSLSIDDIYVGPQVTAVGMAASDWQTYTPVIGATTTAPTLPTGAVTTFKWRRNGDSIQITGQISYSSTTGSAAGSGTYLFPLPTGLVADTTKIAILGNQTVVGEARVSDSANTFVGSAILFNSTNIALSGKFSTNNAGSGTVFDNFIGGAYPFTDTNTPVYYSFTAQIPIAGWSSNVQMSSDTDTRVVAAKLNTLSSTSVPANAAITFTTAEFDTSGALSSLNRFTAPISGIYHISMFADVGNSGSGYYIAKNGSFVNTAANKLGSASSSAGTSGSILMQLNAGDYIQLAANTAYTAGNTLANLSIERLSGPSAIAASESVNATYGLTTAQSVAANAVIKYDTKVKDTHNAFSTATGLFTAPTSGTYLITSSVSTSSGTAAVYYRVNGVAGSGAEFVGVPATGFLYTGSASVPLLAGQTIGVYPDSALTVIASQGNGFYNSFSITRTGN